MELRLVVEGPGAPPRDLAVEIRRSARVAELRNALASHLALDLSQADLQLQSRRTGRRLDLTLTLPEAEVRQGDYFILGAPTVAEERDPGPPVANVPTVPLLVAAGPNTGLCWQLSTGVHQVGRSPQCDVTIGDLSLSRVHLLISVDSSGTVSVADAGSSNGTFMDGVQLVNRTVVGPGSVIEIGHTLLTFAPPAQNQPVRALDVQLRVPFNRPPRALRRPPTLAFKLERLPERPKGQRIPLATCLLPLAAGGGLFIATHQQAMLWFAALSPAMAAGSVLETRFGSRREYRRAASKFREKLSVLEQDIRAAWAAEAQKVRATGIDVATLVRRVNTLDGLWERRPGDPDFLYFRVGWGDRPSGISIEMPAGGEPELRQAVQAVQERHAMLRSVPLVVALPEARVLGLWGERSRVTALGRGLLLQTAILHSPEEVLIAAAVPAEEEREWSWLGWIPHTQPVNAELEGPLVVSGGIHGRELLNRLQDVLTRRKRAAQARQVGAVGAASERAATIVVLVHEATQLPRAVLGGLLTDGPDHGIQVIWLGSRHEDLPGQCQAEVELEPDSFGVRLHLPKLGEMQEAFCADQVPLEVAVEASTVLAGIRDAGSAGSQLEVPDRVGLWDLLGLEADPDRLREWWESDDGLLSAPLGRAASGETFEISLRRDGPHALVGGMTGSGKSELLQSLVASLAARHSPRRLNFLLVDYKGAAAFKVFESLPHTVGLVTDLDGHLVNRALVSLRAEVRRREAVLRDAGAGNLRDLERSRPELAPPSLVIVVDEFATLVTELPEFVDGMVDVAQRGRSLGVHLVLATQRPAGVIKDNIRTNTNLRVSLRFSDDSESKDVIGTPAAARPGLSPGRAFARTGPAAVTEFQAAYGGGHSHSRGPSSDIAVHDLTFGGSVAGAPIGGAAWFAEPTDLERLVEVICELNVALGLPKPAQPWLPTLPEVLPLDELSGEPPLVPGWGPPRALVGRVDEPAAQRQWPLEFRLEEDGAVLIYGTGGAGKTTLLRTLAAALAGTYPPDQLYIYALDFASRGLKPLESLPHCAAMVASNELERATRLLARVRQEIDRRRVLLAANGVSTLSEYLARAAPDADRPRYVLVLLDGYSGFANTFQDVNAGEQIRELQNLIAEGRPLGISFVISADRQAPFLSAISVSVERKLILRMASEDEYHYLGLAPSVFKGASLPPGRGFTEHGLEFQGAVLGGDSAGSAQAAAIAELGAQLQRRFGQVELPRVELLPTQVLWDSLPTPGTAFEAVLGLEDQSLAPAAIDLGYAHFLVAGPVRSGRTTALGTIASSLARRGEVELYLLSANRRTQLASLGIWNSVGLGVEASVELAKKIVARVRDEGAPADGAAHVLLLDGAEEFNERGSMPDLDWLAGPGREYGVRLVVAANNQAAPMIRQPWMTQVKNQLQGLLLNPDPTMDGILLGVRLPPRKSGPMPPGRGYLVSGGTPELIQVGRDVG